MRYSLIQRFHAKAYGGLWKNPFFTDPKIKERNITRVQYFMYTFLFLSGIVTLCTLLFWYTTRPQFALFFFEAEGMRSVPQERIAQNALHEAYTCSYFFAPCIYSWNIEHATLAHVLSAHYSLDYVTLEAQKNTLHISVQESVTLIPLRIGQDVWFSSQDGVLQRIATPEDLQAGIIIPQEVYVEIDVSAYVKNPSPGMTALSPQVIEAIKTYHHSFLTNNVPIQSFALTQDAKKIVAHTQAGFLIFFSPQEPAQIQVDRLTRVLAQGSPKEYADIRFGERIYLK